MSPHGWGPPVLPLPKGIASLVPDRPQGQDNLGLWLDRFLRRDGETWDFKAELRAGQLGALAQRWSRPGVKAALARRGFSLTPTRTAGGLWGVRAVVKQAGPLIIDYGRASTSESGLGLDWVLGAPRLAGSALRGAARRRWEDLLVREERELIELFGQVERAGGLSFYDALPEHGDFTLSLDVLTPHNKAYYEGRSPPGDWLSPSPTTFLVVVNTRFVLDVEGQSEAQVRRGLELLVEALTDHGIGAKTRAGYGWFDPT